ncbi:hypothetical protein N5P29_05985 [Paenarthrobacter sp. JL.01a]|nr:hypothetical protein N5P29_05985 [Paenarthrobacter sp. JL.01a]
MTTQISRAKKRPGAARATRSKAIGIAAIGSLFIALTACAPIGAASSVSSSSGSPSTTSSSTPTPTPSKITGTPCTTEKKTQVLAGQSYVCAVDQAGKLVWMDSATAQALNDQRAAATKAAADKAAADKAAADQAASAKAAADKAAADQAAAAKAAADKAAADQAAANAAKTAPKAAPVAPAAPAQSGCDPNYAGACVPIDSDVDCAGGKGNGPSYVRGPVTVIGSDIYGLDNDHDGIGCEK